MQILSCAVCMCMFVFIPSGWLSRGVIRLRLFDAKYRSTPSGCEPGPHLQRPTRPSAVQHTQTEVRRAEHEHLDHTNEFYFLMADRRTRWTVTVNLPPPPLPPSLTTFNPCRAARGKTCIMVKKKKKRGLIFVRRVNKQLLVASLCYSKQWKMDNVSLALLASLFDLLAERGVCRMSNNKLCSSVTAAVVRVSLKPC